MAPSQAKAQKHGSMAKTEIAKPNATPHNGPLLPVKTMADFLTPPPELVREWSQSQGDTDPEALWFRIAREAAQWGANQELEACREWLWLNTVLPHTVEALYAARRPNPLSTIKIAEEMIARHNDGWTPSPSDWVIIRDALADGRRALEALDD